MLSSRRRTGALAAVGLAAALAVAACGSSSNNSAGSGGGSTHAKHYTFVLSNNFLGNDWRPQVEKLARLTADVLPFKGAVTLKVVNSANTTQAQTADLQNIIQTKPDAILLIPGDSSALDPTITQACNAHILVLTLSVPVGAPCAINLNQNFYNGNVAMGEWMAQAMHGHGTIFVDHGIPGLSISQQIQSGFLAGLKKDGPAIKVAGYYNGQYAAGPEQSGISSLLTAHPSVGGIMTQGYCTPAFNALKAAGKSAVPSVCYGYNGEMQACAQPGHECALLTNTTGQVQLAMQLALNILEGKVKKPAGGPAQKDWIPYPMYMYISASPPNVKIDSGLVTQVETLKSGTNFFPSLPSGLSLPYSLPQFTKYITPSSAAG